MKLNIPPRRRDLERISLTWFNRHGDLLRRTSKMRYSNHITT